ncbi:MAG: glycosyltransferase [Sulfurospirillum sp.]|nr:glycosyltransferase [Sulfurospirillum sp.]
MSISAFTFIKNGEMLGYPFLESIKSVLPIVDEFVINVGESQDNTLEIIQNLNEPKIRVIESKWNDKMKDRVYGNINSYLWSPSWYRSETRIIKNTIRSYAPDGLFWVVLDKNKTGRYPKAVHSGAKIYHYGWARSEEQMNLKSKKVQKYWNKTHKQINYKEIDNQIIKEFKGTHPKVMQKWLTKEKTLFQANPNHKLSRKEIRHRIMLKLEKLFNLELSKKHYRLVK